MMKFAAGIKCTNPNCGAAYDALIEDGYHAECPYCHQVNRVPGKDLSNAISGMCGICERPLDEHLFGRQSYCCPPKGTKE